MTDFALPDTVERWPLTQGRITPHSARKTVRRCY